MLCVDHVGNGWLIYGLSTDRESATVVIDDSCPTNGLPCGHIFSGQTRFQNKTVCRMFRSFKTLQHIALPHLSWINREVRRLSREWIFVINPSSRRHIEITRRYRISFPLYSQSSIELFLHILRAPVHWHPPLAVLNLFLFRNSSIQYLIRWSLSWGQSLNPSWMTKHLGLACIVLHLRVLSTMDE